jgi:transposase
LLRRRSEKSDSEEPADHALGRSRGGFSTKIHILCDRHGHPLHFHLTAGQDHESQSLIELLETATVGDFDNEPVGFPLKLAGDKGFRADWIDEYLLKHGITPVIPSKCNEDPNQRPVEFDRQAYRQRNIIERLIGWLKECRRILTRFEKSAKNFGGMIRMAFIRQYIKTMLN